MTTFDPFDPKTWDTKAPETPRLAAEERAASGPTMWTFGMGNEVYVVDGANIVEAFANAIMGSGKRGVELSVVTQVGESDNPSFGVTSVAILRAVSKGYLDATWVEDSLLLMQQEEEWVARVAVLDVLHPREIRRHLLQHFGKTQEI